ncbi:hypothetical protein [Amycolatopsis benzoatilytica]|uniref:hypothetical protein n=1 Tax=Amycolatopsis benzoatilytica TaxID=346045 RepID=UPI00037FF18B|nr:hypothetical protein [Amycolatopsis benzoatilytica]
MVARTLVSGSMLAVVLGVAACNEGSQAASPAPSLATAPAASASSALPSAPASVPDEAPAAKHKPAAPKPAAAPGKAKAGGLSGSSDSDESHDCGAVDSPGGKVEVTAKETAAGAPGCDESVRVMSHYLAQEPTKAQGSGHFLEVDGWNCGYAGGASGSGQFVCESGDRSFTGTPA